VAASVSLEPLTAKAELVLATGLGARVNADERADILKIDCAGVFDRQDATERVRIPPHFVRVDSDRAVIELVRTVLDEVSAADKDVPGAVDVDAPERIVGKGGKAINVSLGKQTGGSPCPS